jgi:hypothetical protein
MGLLHDTAAVDAAPQSFDLSGLRKCSCIFQFCTGGTVGAGAACRQGGRGEKSSQAACHMEESAM